jgi:hypothetical protein
MGVVEVEKLKTIEREMIERERQQLNYQSREQPTSRMSILGGRGAT